MEIKDKVIPNLVGVDVGCGMYTVKLKEKGWNFLRLIVLYETRSRLEEPFAPVLGNIDMQKISKWDPFDV